MPTRLRYILDRLPLPSLRVYTLFSISLLIANILYYHHLIQSNVDTDHLFHLSNQSNESVENSNRSISTIPYLSLEYLQTLLLTVISQSLSLLVREKRIFLDKIFIE